MRCSTPHCSEVLNDNMHERLRLNKDACKTTQAYDTMEKRRATYPNMLGIARLPKERHILMILKTHTANNIFSNVNGEVVGSNPA